MIAEYMKIARSFNMSLTGLAPVMGALAMGQFDFVILFLLFVVGCFVHAYGFTHNDIVDYQHDRDVPEIAARPLVKGTISKRQAWVFVLLTLLVAFVVSLYASFLTTHHLAFAVFCLPIFAVTLYNYIGKRFAFMDVILGVGMFFLILWGALLQTDDIHQVSLLAWVICFLGGIQVLYMNLVAGGFKDIQHDSQKNAKTTAVTLGVRVIGTKLNVPRTFMLTAYLLQLLNILAAFLPFLFDQSFQSPTMLMYLQLGLLVFASSGMLWFVHKLLSLIQFERAVVRRIIGIQYYVNFCLAPFLLLHVSVWVLTLVFVPVLGFVLSNLLLHEKFMEPEVM